jgi:hypothetical protein
MRRKIPTTIQEAIKRLDRLGQLATAIEWERAAIVYAFTYEGEKGGLGAQGSRKNEASLRHTINDFAELGIHGLRTATTVRKYRSAWKEHGALDLKPGSEVELPDVPWEFRDSDAEKPDEPKPNGRGRTSKHKSVRPEPSADREDRRTGTVRRLLERVQNLLIEAAGEADLLYSEHRVVLQGEVAEETFTALHHWVDQVREAVLKPPADPDEFLRNITGRG